MNVKRYLAKDEQEAMQKIRSELGRDAVILHTRKIKQKGIRGWFSKPLVEVVAAVEANDRSQRLSSGRGNNASNNTHQPDYLREATQALLMERARELERAKDMESKQKSPEPTSVPNNAELEALKAQISSLTEIVKQVVTKVDSQSAAYTAVPVVPGGQVQEAHPAAAAAPEPIIQENPETQLIGEVKGKLAKQMVNEDLSDRVLQILSKQKIVESGVQGLLSNARNIIKELIGAPYRIEKKAEGPQVYFFVGPTGVGKTTTLAKIAAKLSLIEGKRVGLITSDTYRISAVDQLKTYSEILNVPLEVIYEADEIQGVLSKYADKDYVLVDTAGRNHKSTELKSDLTELLKYAKGAEVFLVISLTTSAADVDSIIESYRFIGKFELILTKLDEAATYGNILNTRLRSEQPIAFLTNGQSVPDDIAVADAEKIAALLVGE